MADIVDAIKVLDKLHKKFILKFPLSETDLKILNELNTVFSRDIFVNNFGFKVVREGELPKKRRIKGPK
jgi:hypothetical protein